MQTKRKLTLAKETLRTLNEQDTRAVAGGDDAGFGSYYVCPPTIYVMIKDWVTTWPGSESAVCSNGFCTTSA